MRSVTRVGYGAEQRHSTSTRATIRSVGKSRPAALHTPSPARSVASTRRPASERRRRLRFVWSYDAAHEARDSVSLEYEGVVNR